AFAPDAERDAIVSMLAARPEAEYQLAREPERLAAILARTRQNGYGENFRGWRQEEKIASIAVPVCSQQRVIGCLNLVYIASAMTIEQAAQKHLPALQRVARQIEARMEEEEVWYEMP
ncbi:transcriptional regulator, partial [Klebsiella pneumoniae]